VNRIKWSVILLLLFIALPLIFSEGCGKVDGSLPVNDNSSPTVIKNNSPTVNDNGSPTIKDDGSIVLPEPAHDSDVSLEQALLERRSVRTFKEGALTLKQLAQLLWAAQGITDPSGKRTAPSAGALYPLEVYAVVGNVEGVPPGIYKYKPDSHTLVKVLDGDQRVALSQAAMGQPSVSQGAVDIVITAVYERITSKYGERGIRFVHLEAGHAAQNVCLQVVALKLGTVTTGAFDDDAVKKVLGISGNETPLYIMPVGRTGD
jgi:SagB-type dehydrogenase family enzyme